MAKINIPINVKVSIDSKTKSIVLHSKKYEISAYGKTLNQATKMFTKTVEDIILMSHPDKLIKPKK